MIIEKNYIYNILKPRTNKKIKIASFDLDHTIIKTKSGRVFPKDKDDWELYNNKVIDKLHELYNDNYEILFFTNQSSLSKSEKKKEDFILKINNIIKYINLPISYFISTNYGYYRKPCTGLFQLYIDYISPKIINYKNSFYCGDAAGREKGWMNIKKKKDFSSSDLFFAKNINLKFFLPEEIFGDYKNLEIKLPVRKFLKCKQSKIILPVSKKLKNYIILVGKPASGKSFLAKEIKELCKNLYFEILSKDKLKTKYKKMFNENLDKGKNLILDATNNKKDEREFFIKEINKKFKSEERNIICIEVNTDDEMIKQLNYFRVEYSKGKENFIKDVVYRVYNKYYNKPLKKEGFNFILNYKSCPQFTGKKKKIFEYYY